MRSAASRLHCAGTASLPGNVNNPVNSIAHLIQGAREGSEARLDELLGACRHYLRVLATACLHRDLRSKADASDVVQDTLLKAHQRFGQFRGNTEGEWVAWIKQILVRNIADLNRRFSLAGHDVSRETSLEEAMEQSSVILRRLCADAVQSPSDAAVRQEVDAVLAGVLAELDEQDREIVILRNVQDLDWNEIGLRTQRSPDAARMRWTRALQQLGTLLKERLHGH